MSRIRNPFKRQDSYAVTDSKANAPAELGRSSTREDQYELDSLGDRKDRGVERDEHHPEDPAALGVDELDQADRLSNGKERPIEVGRFPSFCGRRSLITLTYSLPRTGQTVSSLPLTTPRCPFIPSGCTSSVSDSPSSCAEPALIACLQVSV